MPNYETEVQAILSVPCVAAVTPAYEHETEFSVQVGPEIYLLKRTSVLKMTVDSCTPHICYLPSSTVIYFDLGASH